MGTARDIAAGLVLPIVFAAAFVGPLNRPVLTQSTSVCGCPDVTDMINRLNMAEAAIELIKADIPRYAAAEKRTGDVPYTNTVNPDGRTNYEHFRESITNGMAKFTQMLGANVSWGHTDLSCNAGVVKRSTACMDHIVDQHEQRIHKPACDKDKGGLPWRPAQHMADYAREEILGYEEEIKVIRELLRTMPASCRPGRIGFIQYYEMRTVETNMTLPPTQSRVSGSDHSLTEVMRSAKILFREHQPSTLNLEIKEERALTTQTVMRIGCEGGLMTPKFTHVRSSTVKARGTVEVRGHEGTITATFGYDPKTGDWTLDFTFPSTTGTGTSITTETQSGNCLTIDDREKATGSDGLTATYSSDTVSASGKTGLNLDVVRVEYPLITHPLSAPNVSFTHTGRIVFSIYKQ